MSGGCQNFKSVQGSDELAQIADELSQEKPTIERMVESMDDQQLARFANAVGAQIEKRSQPSFGDMTDAQFRAAVDDDMRQAGRRNG